MKVLITGGHFSPAYSLIKELKARKDTIAIAGRKRTFEGEDTESLEFLVSKKERIPFYEIKTGRIQRKFTIHTIPSVLRTVRGLASSLKAISDFKPDVVVTFGGYVGFPVAYAAKLKGIPVVLHEQTQKAGLASRAIAKIATKICVSFDTSREFFPNKKVVFTGNPIREEIFETKKEIPLKKDKPVIYITGGSSGSHVLNSMVLETISTLVKKYNVILQSGENKAFNDFEKLEEKRNKLKEEQKERFTLRKFIYPDEIGYVFKSVDLVISRSGINTVMELLSLGKLCLLVPLTSGQTNEQLDNAKFVRKVGIGDYIEERELTEDVFLDKIDEMIKDRKEYEKNSKSAGDYIVNDATKRIIKVIDEVNDK